MPNGGDPDHRDIWETLNQARLDIAELKGMLAMHFKSEEHHHPPCKAIADMQKTIMSAMWTALVALVGAVGSVVIGFIKKGG